jgi:hypothetical protein
MDQRKIRGDSIMYTDTENEVCSFNTKELTKPAMKNTLLVYHGGGYDGCIWEWNAAAWDSKGNFHDIYSSGCDGLFSRYGASNWQGRSEKGNLIHPEPEKTALEWIENEENSCELIDLTNTKALENFSAFYNSVLVYGCIKAINDMKDMPEVFFVCSECGEHISSEGFLEDWHGCGGIASTADTLLCEDCLSEGSCMECGEYVGKDQIEHGGYCEWCIKNALNKEPEIKEAIEEIENEIEVVRSQVKEYCKIVPAFQAKAEKFMTDFEVESQAKISDLINEAIA